MCLYMSEKWLWVIAVGCLSSLGMPLFLYCILCHTHHAQSVFTANGYRYIDGLQRDAALGMPKQDDEAEFQHPAVPAALHGGMNGGA